MKALRNFYWWLCGFFSSFALVAGGTAIVIFAIPAGTFINNNKEYMDEELQKMNLFTLFTQANTIEIGQIPILKKALQDWCTQNDMDRFISVDWDKFDHVQFGDFQQIQNLFTEAVTVTATLETLDIMKDMGALGELPVFQNFDVLTPEAQQALDETAPGFVKELYYYQVDATPTYAKVYNGKGEKKPEAEGKPYYYPALKDVNILDIPKVVPERLGHEKVRNIIGVASPIEEGSIIDVVMKDYTLREIGGIKPQDLMKDIKLSLFFPVAGNEQLYDVLLGATSYQGLPEDITLHDLNGTINTDNIKLSVLLGDYASNKNLYDILVSATTRPGATPSDLNLGDIKGLNVDNITLNSVLGSYETNKNLYDILISAVSRPAGSAAVDASNINIGDLKNLDVQNIKIEAVLPKTEQNQTLYKILSSATGVKEADLTINALNSFVPGKVKIVDVVPYKDATGAYVNVDFYKIVKAVANATTDAEVEAVTIDQIQSMETNKIKLNAVLDPATNRDIYDLLKVAIEPQPGDTRVEFTDDNLMIGDLQHFKIPRIPFHHFVKPYENPRLVEIMKDATGKTAYEDIIVGDIQNEKTFNINNIHLKNFMNETEAGILGTILTDLSGSAYDDLTLNSLKGLDINKLHLAKVLTTPGATLESILVQATGASSFQDVTIGNLNGGFDINKVALSTVLNTTNENLKSIIAEATGKTYESVTILDLANGFNIDNIKLSTVMKNPDAKLSSFMEQATGKPFSAICIGDLGSTAFHTDNVKLSAFIPETPDNKGLYDCLRDALGVATNSEITIGKLNAGFNMSSIKISTVMSSSSSPIVQALIDKGTTLGNFGATVDALTLYEIYGKDCFSPKSSVSSTGDKYKAVKDINGNITSYVYDPNLVDDPSNDNDGVYYLNNQSSIWSLLCFETPQNDPANGRGLTYQVSTKAFKDLEGNAAGKALENSTIYELIASGLLQDSNYKDQVKARTVKELLDAMSMIP